MRASEELKKEFIRILENEIQNQPVYFYLGGYGYFDYLCYHICKEYQQKHSNSVLCFITPYTDEKYLKNKTYGMEYDMILHIIPNNTPKSVAIIRRNYEMFKKSDLVITYIQFPNGNAGKSLEYIKRLKKKRIELYKE